MGAVFTFFSIWICSFLHIVVIEKGNHILVIEDQFIYERVYSRIQVKIIENHNGTLLISSVENKETTIEVTLPM
ncbi:hypothetical protein QE429_000650 [Bacillus sp. SORGH_AS 510]|uniref:hypothetical protein n=1 Tax=Bacillus sp. SORGH_AS_0510 TaxID=3041771 RepID=UPI00278A5C93|nr:hypothetical protein [Bacillus sp. SORGH_AS_0510]MDQ1143823.1 hypothetical protein [Bacillus sp. SORGH_AS_0510]